MLEKETKKSLKKRLFTASSGTGYIHMHTDNKEWDLFSYEFL